MESIRKNIFLTGAPSAGKTTVIRKVLKALPVPANGFYTQEEREGDRRVGFMMHSLDGEQAYLAHQDISSDHHIRRYGVSLENICNLAVPSIRPRDNQVIILDESGKMECFCPEFVEAAQRALDAPQPVIGTITYGRHGFIAEVKARDDIEIIEVTDENRNELPGLILQKLEQLIPGAH